MYCCTWTQSCTDAFMYCCTWRQSYKYCLQVWYSTQRLKYGNSTIPGDTSFLGLNNSKLNDALDKRTSAAPLIINHWDIDIEEM